MIVTTVTCFRTVWVARIAQEPSTAYSGESGFLKFSERERTHFEIIDGHLFNNFIRDFPARLTQQVKILNERCYRTFNTGLEIVYKIGKSQKYAELTSIV